MERIFEINQNAPEIQSQENLDILSNLNQELEKRLKNVDYEFKDKDEVYKFQLVLIEMIQTLLTYLKEMELSKKEKQHLNNCMKLLIKRGELNFAFIHENQH